MKPLNNEFETELDDLLSTMKTSLEDAEFYAKTMVELKMEITPLSREEMALVNRSNSPEELTAEEKEKVKTIIARSQFEAEIQDDKIKAYLFQANRTVSTPELMIH